MNEAVAVLAHHVMTTDSGWAIIRHINLGGTMTDGGVAIAWSVGQLFLRTFVKSASDASDGKTFTSAVRGALTDTLAEDGNEALKAIFSTLGLARRETRPSHGETYCLFDVAGLAWAQCLETTNLALIDETFRTKQIDKIKKQLSPAWFSEIMMDDRVLSSINQNTDFQRTGEIGRDAQAAIIQAIARSIETELHLEPPIRDAALVDIVGRMPDKIESIISTIPSAIQAMTKAVAEQTLYHASGEASRVELHAGMERLARLLVDARKKDVFGRTAYKAGELALLPLQETYVEPLARAHTVGAPPTLNIKTPSIQTIENSLNEKGALLVVSAPFGYGKSLTFKSLAASLAEKWLAAPDNALYPVLVKCPEIFTRHTQTLEDSVQKKLTRDANLRSAEVEQIWKEHRVALLLDGFDEVVLSNKEAKEWFKEMRALVTSGRAKVVLSSRPNAVQDKWLEAGDIRIELETFTPTQAQEWLDANSKAIAGKNLKFDAIARQLDQDDARIPIILLMATYGYATSASAPTTKSDVYDSFIRQISKGKWTQVQTAHPVLQQSVDTLTERFGSNAFEHALELVAWSSFRKQSSYDDGPPDLSRREIEKVLERHFAQLRADNIDELVHSLCLSLFMHKGAEDQLIRFTHKSFREFLCARHLANALQKNPGIDIRTAAWRLLADARLRETELEFLTQMLSGANNKESIIDSLVRISDGEFKTIIVADPGFVLDKSDTDQQIVITEQPNQFIILTENAEALCRRLIGVRIPLGHSRRTGSFEETQIGTWRIADYDSDFPFVYHRQSRLVGFAMPIAYHDDYKVIADANPDLFVPIVERTGRFCIAADKGLWRIEPAYYPDFSTWLPTLRRLQQVAPLNILPYQISLSAVVRIGDEIKFAAISPSTNPPDHQLRFRLVAALLSAIQRFKEEDRPAAFELAREVCKDGPLNLGLIVRQMEKLPPMADDDLDIYD